MEYEVQVLTDAKTTAQTVLLRIWVGGVSFVANLLPRDAREIGRILSEGARVATTGVIIPQPSDVKRIIQ
jgi:hypothetical protein